MRNGLLSSRRSVFWVFFGVLGTIAFIYGIRRMQDNRVRDEVIAILRSPDRMGQTQSFVRLRQTNRVESARVAANLLDHPEKGIRRSAVRAIPILQAQAEVADALVHQLRINTDPDVRLGCAINLMMVKSEPVRAAFIDALRDPDDHVLQVACVEVGYRGGPGAKGALEAVLNHASWRVRLEACKGLIVSKDAGGQVIRTLEKMSEEPEAAIYDAEIEDFDRHDRQVGADPIEGEWGNLGSILKQARQVAAKNR